MTLQKGMTQMHEDMAQEDEDDAYEENLFLFMNYDTICILILHIIYLCSMDNNTNCSAYYCPAKKARKYRREKEADDAYYNEKASEAVETYGSNTFKITNFKQLDEA